MIGSRATVALMRLKEIENKYKVRRNDYHKEQDLSSENTESLVEASVPKKNVNRVSTIPEERKILKSTLNIKIPDACAEQLESRSSTSNNDVSIRVTTVAKNSRVRKIEKSRSTTGSEKSRSTHDSERSLSSMQIKESLGTNVSQKPRSLIQIEKSSSATEIDEILDEENSIAVILERSNISDSKPSETFDNRWANLLIMPVHKSVTKDQSKSFYSSAESTSPEGYSDDSFESLTSEKRSSNHLPINETASEAISVPLSTVHSVVSETRRTFDNKSCESGNSTGISNSTGTSQSGNVESNGSTQSRKTLDIRDRGIDREGSSQSLKHRRPKYVALDLSPTKTVSSTKDETKKGGVSVEHPKSADSQCTKSGSSKRKFVSVKTSGEPSNNEISSNSQISFDPTHSKLDPEKESKILQNRGKSVASESFANSRDDPKLTRPASDLVSPKTEDSITADQTRKTEELSDYQKSVDLDDAASDTGKNAPLNSSYEVKRMQERGRTISENLDKSKIGKDGEAIESRSDPSSQICQSRSEPDISSTRREKLEDELLENLKGTDRRARCTLEMTQRSDSFLDNKKAVGSKKRAPFREQLRKESTVKASRLSTSYRPTRKIQRRDYRDRELQRLEERKNNLRMEQERELMLRYSSIFEEDKKRLFLWPDKLNCSGKPEISVIQPLDFPNVANFTEPDKRSKKDTVIVDIHLEILKNRIVEIRRWLKDQFILYRDYCDVAAAINAKYVIDERISRKASHTALSRARRDSPEFRGYR